jgi:hypothetical protein
VRPIQNKSRKILPSMHNISLGIINGNYMCHLQSSTHQAVYVKNTKSNHILETMISGRYRGLTYKHI